MQTKRGRCENDGVDESAKRFQAKQKRLAEVGGPIRSLKRQIANGMIALGAFATAVWVLGEGLSALPRNPDNSIKLIYFGPVLITLSAIATLFIRTDNTKRRPLMIVAWSMIALAVIAIPAGVVDSLARTGG